MFAPAQWSIVASSIFASTVVGGVDEHRVFEANGIADAIVDGL